MEILLVRMLCQMEKFEEKEEKMKKIFPAPSMSTSPSLEDCICTIITSEVCS
jgi:hypothetical protein